MNNCTPGPWHVKRVPLVGGLTRADSILSEDGSSICEGLHWNNNGEVDAHIIAAPPELMEALQMAMEWVPDQATIMHKRANRAIAKATGNEEP
jgi:hypothetical protein